MVDEVIREIASRGNVVSYRNLKTLIPPEEDDKGGHYGDFFD